MKKTPKIPKGWRTVRVGTKVKAGDKIWLSGKFQNLSPYDSKGNDAWVFWWESVIRRVKRK